MPVTQAVWESVSFLLPFFLSEDNIPQGRALEGRPPIVTPYNKSKKSCLHASHRLHPSGNSVNETNRDAENWLSYSFIYLFAQGVERSLLFVLI